MDTKLLTRPRASSLRPLTRRRVGALRDSSLLISDARALRERFDRDGYALLRDLVDVGHVEALSTEVMAILRAQGLLAPGDDVVARYRRQRASFEAAVQRLERFHSLPYDPALLRVVRMLVGDDAFAHPQRLIRAIWPAIPELTTPPHQDFAYIRGTEKTVTAWLPLFDVESGEGALRVLVGSHKRGHLPLRGSPALANFCVDVADDDPAWASTDLGPGDVLLFHSMTVHSATPNVSDRMRLSVDYRYQPASHPVADRSLTPCGFPQVPDWPELLTGVAWSPERWLSVPTETAIVGFEDAGPGSRGR